MHHPEYDIYIDTGGTFTDCIAIDTNGIIHKKKVLSNGSVRGQISRWIGNKSFRVEEKWELGRDILGGYIFRLLDHDHETIHVDHFDIENKILVVTHPLPDRFVGQPLSFELRSGEEAPVLATRLVTCRGLNDPLPVRSIKLGSTKGTNALLERKGSKCLFLVTAGFHDVLDIGYQERPDIFARHVIKPGRLYIKVLEVEERIDSTGQVLKEIDTDPFKKKILDLMAEQAFDSVAIAFMNSYKNPAHELEAKKICEALGFQHVSVSSDLSGLIRYIPRAETAVVNAYLQPIIHTYIRNIQNSVKPNSFHIMNSAGGLVKAAFFDPKDSLLSGPAGGVVGASAIGKAAGYSKILSFDMGGTSTDVARFDGGYDYRFNIRVGDAKIFSPALSIETVASGGGSICTPLIY